MLKKITIMTLKGVIECMPELELIKKQRNKKQRQNIIANCSDRTFLAICEICINILNGVIPLKPRSLLKLQNHKKILRKLAQKKLSIATRKKIIYQEGGALPSILLPALSFLSSLFI